MKTANLNAGLALRKLMLENEITGVQLAFDLGISTMTVSALRRSKLISGSKLLMLSEYFGMTAAEFIKKGEV